MPARTGDKRGVSTAELQQHGQCVHHHLSYTTPYQGSHLGFHIRDRQPHLPGQECHSVSMAGGGYMSSAHQLVQIGCFACWLFVQFRNHSD